MTSPTIADLFVEAGKRLRSDFEYIRASNPHAGEMGEEVESVLKQFLNAHMPGRFRAGSGMIIDFENHVSRQTDVIVYDALSSPVYRSAEKTQILPAHNVAAVMEVKSQLTKKQLKDGFEKIASCKALKKPILSNVDQRSTPSDLATTGTMGVIFAFGSDATLQTIAENTAELNAEYESHLWPDAIVVLDKGVITYAIQWPGDGGMAGTFGVRPTIGEAKYYPPPWYVHLIMHEDGELTLNRFFLLLQAHLTFYPYRHSTPFEAMLRQATTQGMTIQGYQFTAKEELVPVSEKLYNENKPTVQLAMEILANETELLAVLQYFEWGEGGVVRKFGPLPLGGLLPLFIADPKAMVLRETNRHGVELSNILPLTADDFRKWPAILEKKSNMKAVLREGDSASQVVAPGATVAEGEEPHGG